MAELKSYKGHLKNGRFIADGEADLPENAEVVITILGDEMPEKSAYDVVTRVLESIRETNAQGHDAETLEMFEMWDKGEFKSNFRERAL